MFSRNPFLSKRYIYATPLPKNINKDTLKVGFDVLFNGPQKMPRFVDKHHVICH